MLQAWVLLQLTLWVTLIQAFYIFSDDSPDSPGSKRALEGPGPTIGQGISFPISGRVVKDVDDPDLRAARSAARLARKYASRGSGTSDLDRRANKYQFLTASTPTVPNSAGVNQEGSDLYYFITVGVGSEQKPFLMLLDSGAGTSWVMGSTCKSDPCSKHDSFGPSDSKTFQTDSKTFSINYGSGSVSGTLVKDTLSAAGLKVNMSFGLANVTSDDFNNFPFDGILGLSPTTGATDNFVQILKNTKALASNIFALSLSRTSDGPNTGEVTFGATNPAKYTGSIAYTATTDKGGDWAINMDGMGFDGKKADLPTRKTFIDTGTSFAFGPPSDVAALHKLIPGSTTSDQVKYQVPCTTTQSITVTFSGVAYEIAVQDWISGADSNGICTSHIYGHEVVQDAWLLGDIFLKNVYTVFDFDQSRIGFAKKPVVVPVSSTVASPAVSTVPAKTVTTDGKTTTVPATVITSPASSSPTTGIPGLSGHETAATAGGTAVPETTGKPVGPNQSSNGEQLESRNFVSIVCMVAIIAMVA
ncbi:acid protease [Thozetella sp. PMI_491]|nr:acid protease [Thozetella sp. PMI_491]